MKKRNTNIITFILFFVVSLNSQTIFTCAGIGTCSCNGDGGPAISAGIGNPTGIATDKNGNVYFATLSIIRKINPSGIINSVGGSCTIGAGYSGDGGPATLASFNTPEGIAVDTSGNIYIADQGNYVIRKISTTGIVTTICGNGTFGFSGDGGQAVAAQIGAPIGITVDIFGNVYFTDGAILGSRIRKIDTSGIITTIAGTGADGFSGDGGLSVSAQISMPYGIVTDLTGNIFFCDLGNFRIRKISTSGIISTIAGTGINASTGDGGLAALADIEPYFLARDIAGNLYFTESSNCRIRKIDLSGIITTYAGGPCGYFGDGGPATMAGLSAPNGIAVDYLGNLYVGQWTTSCCPCVIRVVCPSTCLTGINDNGYNHNLSLYPNPTTDVIKILDEHIKVSDSELEVFNSIGQRVLRTFNVTRIDVSCLPSGYYFIKIKTRDKELHSKFIKN